MHRNQGQEQKASVIFRSQVRPEGQGQAGSADGSGNCWSLVYIIYTNGQLSECEKSEGKVEVK